MAVPFRWNLQRREQLGRLVEGPPALAYEEIVDDIRSCASRVITMSRDSDLIFIGRSPDSVFDYLSGALRGTSWESRLALANLSLRQANMREVQREMPERVRALHDHLTQLELEPSTLIIRRPVAFVDLVHSGSTFESLFHLFRDWSMQLSVDLNAVLRKVRFLGITWRKKNSPNTFRWHQHADWLSAFPKDAVKNVSIPGRLWDYLGNVQPKMALANPPWRWGAPETLQPPHNPGNLEALRFALRMYDLGAAPTHREAFTAHLAASPEMKHAWLRALVSELRRGAG